MFCGIVAGELPSEKVWEDEDFVVIKDANPKVPGHSLVISKGHYETFLDMPEGLYSGMLKIAKEATLKILEEVDAGGFNLVVNNKRVSGQLVPHVHMHILPRKPSDDFKIGV